MGNRKMHHHKVAFLLSLLTLIGCEGEKFKSSGNSGRDSLGYNCNQQAQTDTVRGDFGNGMVFDGQLCPVGLNAQGAPPINLIFALDFSGSMENADPVANNTCGRLQAAQNVISAYNTFDKVNYQVFIIGFHDRAELLAQGVGRNQVQSFLTAQNFCEARSVTNKNLGANTNYEDGLDRVSAIIQSTRGSESKIFFLTDGIPSIGSSTPLDKTANQIAESGTTLFEIALEDTKAAHRRLSQLSAWEMYAIYLRYTKEANLAIEPLELLTLMTGRAGNVAEVSNAGSLAQIIQNFTPKQGPVNPQDVVIQVRAQGFPTKTFQIDSTTFNWSGNDLEPISFKSLPIQLHGTPGSVTRNTISISANDARFRTFEAIVDWDLTSQTGAILNNQNQQQ